MRTKTCKQCGEIKPIVQFRTYYGGRKGTYSTCKACETINSRVKYLTNKSILSNEEQDELDKIHQLWTIQRKAGLQPPRVNTGRKIPLAESLDDMIDKYTKQASKVKEAVHGTDLESIPAELQKWLYEEELVEEPEYYQENIYEHLKETYRPKLQIDKKTMLPVYDDTYKVILEKVLARFDAYEDTYYDK
jgi:hypothetical protein